MILYRPFLHYASQSTPARTVDKRSFACAAACVSVSRNVIHITSEMKRNGLLSGAYWFAMYTTFFAVLSLVFYVIENPRNAASQEILRDAREGKDTLACLAPRSMAADRSSQYLAVSISRIQIRQMLTFALRNSLNSSLKLSRPGNWYPYHRRSDRHLRRMLLRSIQRLSRMSEAVKAVGKVQMAGQVLCLVVIIPIGSVRLDLMIIQSFLGNPHSIYNLPFGKVHNKRSGLVALHTVSSTSIPSKRKVCLTALHNPVSPLRGPPQATSFLICQL